MEDDSGHIGVGEVPGGEAIWRTLEDAASLIVEMPIGSYNSLLERVRKTFADRDSGGRGKGLAL